MTKARPYKELVLEAMMRFPSQYESENHVLLAMFTTRSLVYVNDEGVLCEEWTYDKNPRTPIDRTKQSIIGSPDDKNAIRWEKENDCCYYPVGDNTLFSINGWYQTKGFLANDIFNQILNKTWEWKTKMPADYREQLSSFCYFIMMYEEEIYECYRLAYSKVHNGIYWKERFVSDMEDFKKIKAAAYNIRKLLHPPAANAEPAIDYKKVVNEQVAETLTRINNLKKSVDKV